MKAQKYKYRILLPSYTQTQPKDIETMDTRTWVVPGEKILLYVKVENYKNISDSFSFFCSTIDCNKRILPQQLAQGDQNRELLIDKEIVYHTKVITNTNIPNASPFRSSDTTLYFPMKMLIPITDDDEVTIGAFMIRGEDPVTTLKCRTLHPFIIRKKLTYTPQNYAISFRCNVKIPDEFDEPVNIFAAQLKFDEKIISTYDVASNVCIISTSDYTTPVLNGDEVSLVFLAKALNEKGASILATMPLALNIQWRVSCLDFTTVYPFSAGDYSDLLSGIDQTVVSSILSSVVVSASSIDCELMQEATIPVTLTSIKKPEKEDTKISLHFDCKGIQPNIDTFDVNLKDIEVQQKVINFSFIPIVCGIHNLSITAIVDQQSETNAAKSLQEQHQESKTNYRTVFPIYINVKNFKN